MSKKTVSFIKCIIRGLGVLLIAFGLLVFLFIFAGLAGIDKDIDISYLVISVLIMFGVSLVSVTLGYFSVSLGGKGNE